jgi:4-hydroxythreonine-4-phosphate dehydrogenase
MKNKFIFTCGDINGIGPEIVIKSLVQLQMKKGNQYIFICPSNVYRKTLSNLNINLDVKDITRKNDIGDENIILFDIGNFKQNIGKATKNSGEASFIALEEAKGLLKNGFADSLVTAPISKEALNSAGHIFPGHTEMLAEWFDIKNFVMMFLSKKLKAALVTIHKPLSKVPALISFDTLMSVCNVTINSLKNDFKISDPKIGITGLNPHAGESGLIGKEEEEIIVPFIKNSKYKKYLNGPFSPDAYWGNKMYEKFDITLGMYHDQVLIPFKLLNFSKGVNYTAGLPIVRTSPDHGCGYDIAGKNRANKNSFLEAVYFAENILRNRKS